MKKQILNLGKALNKAEQKSINGGAGGCSDTYYSCMSLCTAGNCYTMGYTDGDEFVNCFVCITEEY